MTGRLLGPPKVTVKSGEKRRKTSGDYRPMPRNEVQLGRSDYRAIIGGQPVAHKCPVDVPDGQSCMLEGIISNDHTKLQIL